MKQAYSPEWHDVFLSHTRADREQAEQLAEQLRAAGLSVYLDVDDEALSRLHGRELAERLKNILSRSRLLLFVFSARSTESRWMPWELGLAHGVVGRVLLWPLNAAAWRMLSRPALAWRRVSPAQASLALALSTTWVMPALISSVETAIWLEAWVCSAEPAAA